MDEEQLVRGLSSKDPRAIEDLLTLYGDRLFRSACLLCGGEAEAEDLVQQTFLEAISAARRFGGRSGLYAWLHGILRNLTRHHHRDRRRLVYDDELAGRAAASAPDGTFTLDIEAAGAALVTALRQLSELHREVLVLRFYEGMKIEEMAAHLEISTGTVKSRLHYALAEMQRLMPAEMNLFGRCGTEEKR